jgi:HlyD family secretion protein
MRRLLRWVVTLSILAGLGVAVTYPAVQWWKKRSQVKYLTAEVNRGRVETVVNSTGTVKPVRTVAVGAFVSGPLTEVYVDFNSVVKKGDLLAKIDPRLYDAAVARDRAALATRKAELARVEATLQQAKNNEGRARKLRAINEDYLSDTEMDQFRFTRQGEEANRELALAAITQAEANLENSLANLGYTEIRSPVDGIVISRKVDPGQTVAASFQTPELFTVAPEMEQHMHIFASVDEADIGLIREAQDSSRAVKFTVDAYPNDLFEGTIYQIRKNGTTEQNVVTYPVVIEAPNPDLKLMPGMTANISFLIEAKEDVVRVPAAALRFIPLPAQVRPEDRHLLEPTMNRPDEGGKPSASEKAEAARKRQRRLIWVQDGDLLRALPVTLGLVENKYAELVEGDLKVGDAVVTGVDSSYPAR